ncbi:hypothetical protein HZH68_013854 [Vespula germanica]|uniref:Uncharacterized protein n=1 Tax=Vespula germanica TaxID=30212 RepID=A0A834JE53_VESGE|nr:hypothetical protein HZH68_013854 [Vespula germanica]
MGLLESTVTTTECKAKGEAKRESQKRGNRFEDNVSFLSNLREDQCGCQQLGAGATLGSKKEEGSFNGGGSSKFKPRTCFAFSSALKKEREG